MTIKHAPRLIKFEEFFSKLSNFLGEDYEDCMTCKLYTHKSAGRITIAMDSYVVKIEVREED